MVDAASVFAGAAAGALLTLVLFVLLPWFLLEDLLSGKKELLRAQFVHNALIVRKGVMRRVRGEGMNFLNVATALLQKYGIPYNLGSTASQARIKAEEHIAGVYLPCSLRRQLYSVLTLAQQEETTDDILVANPAADAALQRFRERANMMAPDPATNAALQRFRQRAMQRAVQGGALSAASSAGNV